MLRRGAVGCPGAGELNGPVARTAAPLRRGALLALVALTAPLAGCATKKDMKLVRDQMVALQARQDSLLQMMRGQVLDSLRANQELLLRVRGDLGHQLLQMEQQLVQIQELTGQSQRRLGELRQQMEARSQQFVTELPSRAEGTAGSGVEGGDAEKLYMAGRQKLGEGAAATARIAFQQIIQNYPTHPLAPDAQLQIAETYAAEKNYDRAYTEFDKVIELFPNSERAPSALYRAGVVAREQGNIERARAYFNRVRSGYPKSDEARLAGEELKRLGRR